MVMQLLLDFIQEHQTVDEWWLAIDGKIMDNTVPSHEVKRICEELPRSRIHVMHVINEDSEDASWMEVQAKSAPREEGSEATALAEANGRIDNLEAKVELLQHTLDAMIDMLRELDSFEDLRKLLDERSDFIHQSEEALIAQTMAFEERNAELEQKREDMGLA